MKFVGLLVVGLLIERKDNMKNMIFWLFDDEEEDDESFDLCGRYKNKYVDIVSNSKKEWSVYLDDLKIKEGFKNRVDAKKWFEENNLNYF